MATRMQQRRGTAQQWLDADPVLAAGEIGFETDTNEFRIGDGVNVWSDLSPFKNLEDLGGSLDDYVLVSSKGQIDGVAPLNANGQIPVAFLAELIDDAPAALNTLGEIADLLTAVETSVGSSVAAHSGDTTDVHGIADTSLLVTQTEAEEIANIKVGVHSADTSNVHGITDTTILATTINVNDAKLEAQTFSTDALSAHNLETENVHGIANTGLLATSSDVSDAVSDHNDATLTVHGIANTALLETQTGAQNKADAAEAAAILAAGTAADTKVSDHNADTTSVHGIADTSALATKNYADGAVSTAVAALTKSSVGLANVDNTADADKPVSTATQTALDLKAPLADPTFTGTVSGVTKSHVGLGNVDNTSDANKPVSTATQTALDLKAPLSAPTFTGTVTSTNDLVVDGNLTVNGTTFSASSTSITIEDNLVQLAHQNSGNTVDLGIVVGYNDGAAKHSGLVRDVSDSKWKLFKGVTTEPTTTVDFTQGSLDDLAVAALTATTVTPSSGIVFSDGTQTKVGVPSITTFATAISSSATLAAGEQDKFVPLTGAVTITLPATGYSTGQSIDFYQASGTGAQFASTNSVVGTPGLKFRTTNSVVTAMKTSSGWLVFGDLSA